VDSIAAVRKKTVGAASVGLDIAVLGAVVTRFACIDDSVSAACFEAVCTTSVCGHVGVFISVVALFLAFADSVAADCGGIVIVVVFVRVLAAVVVAAGAQEHCGET
jgi:hypothetical protein